MATGTDHPEYPSPSMPLLSISVTDEPAGCGVQVVPTHTPSLAVVILNLLLKADYERHRHLRSDDRPCNGVTRDTRVARTGGAKPRKREKALE
jgi:hypothetical protein